MYQTGSGANPSLLAPRPSLPWLDTVQAAWHGVAQHGEPPSCRGSRYVCVLYRLSVGCLLSAACMVWRVLGGLEGRHRGLCTYVHRTQHIYRVIETLWCTDIFKVCWGLGATTANREPRHNI